MNQIINMAVRMIMRKLITLGIDKGVDAMAKRNGHKEADSAQQAQTAESTKRTKQSIRMMRRLGRF